jgi:hypothetical protein
VARQKQRAGEGATRRGCRARERAALRGAGEGGAAGGRKGGGAEEDDDTTGGRNGGGAVGRKGGAGFLVRTARLRKTEQPCLGRVKK